MARTDSCRSFVIPRLSQVAMAGLCLMLLACAGCSDQKQQARTLLEQALNRQQEESHEDAIRLLDRAVALDADLAEAVFARGVSEMHLQNYEESDQQIRRALQMKSDWPQAWWTLATVHRIRNQPDQALDALSRAIRLNPHFPEARYDRACLHQQSGRPTEALEDLDQVLQWQPEHQDALLRRGCLRRQVGEIQAASSDLSQLIRLDRNCAAAWYERARICQAEDDPERALADVTVACRIDTQHPDYREMRAQLLNQLGRSREAAEDYGRLADLQDQSGTALLQAALAWDACGDTEQAIQCLEVVFQQPQSDPDIYFLRARLRRNLGDTTGELQDLESFWQLNPGDRETGERLVRARLAAGQLSESLELATELLEMSDEPPADLIFLRAEIYSRQDRISDAIQDYSRLTEFETHRRIGQQERGHLLLQTGQWEAAAEDFSSLLNERPADFETLVQRAAAYEGAGELSRAVADLTKVLTFHTEDVASLYKRGRLRCQMGHELGAEEDLTRVCQLNPQHHRAMEQLSLLAMDRNDYDAVIDTLLQIDSTWPNATRLYCLRAEAEQGRRDYSAAILDCTQALQLNDSCVPALMRRSELLLKLGNIEAAAADVNLAIDLSTPSSDLYELRGLVCNAQGRTDAAMRDFTRAIELNPEAIRSRLARARLYEDSLDSPGTIEDTTAVLQQKPDLRAARLMRANALYEQSNYQAALEDLDHLLESRLLFRADTDLLWKRCQCRLELQETDGLVTDLTEILTEQPDHTDARLARAGYFESRGQLREAEDDLNEVLTADPDHLPALTRRASLKHRTGRFESAVEDLTMAIGLAPEDARLHYQRGLARVRQSNYESARSDLDRAIELDETPADYWYVRGNLFARERKHREAIRHYRQATSRDTSHAAAWYNCGNLLFEQTKDEEAIECWDRAIAVQPDLFRAWNNRAAALSRLNRDAEALSNYRRAIEINPDFAQAYDNLAWLLATAKETEIRDVEQAVRMATTACRLTGNQNWAFLSTLAACHAEAGDFTKADAALQAALKLAPQGERTRLQRLGRIYRSNLNRMARTSRARQMTR